LFIGRKPILYKSSTRVLKVMNSVFSLIVVWNVISLIIERR